MINRKVPPNRNVITIEDSNWVVQITDDDSRTLLDPVSGSGLHSASGALSETEHVYVNNSGVADRLALREPTQVLEVGLGTGMAMLLSIDKAIMANCKLRYVALENTLLDANVIDALNLENHLANTELAKRFAQWREGLGQHPAIGTYDWEVASGIQLTVVLDDALNWQATSHAPFDAIYFDPFAPSVNPTLWNPSFLARMIQALKPEGRLVTYCVSRDVRDAFASVGFDVRRVRGPAGGKREVLIATKGNPT